MLERGDIGYEHITRPEEKHPKIKWPNRTLRTRTPQNPVRRRRPWRRTRRGPHEQRRHGASAHETWAAAGCARGCVFRAVYNICGLPAMYIYTCALNAVVLRALCLCVLRDLVCRFSVMCLCALVCLCVVRAIYGVKRPRTTVENTLAERTHTRREDRGTDTDETRAHRAAPHNAIHPHGAAGPLSR